MSDPTSPVRLRRVVMKKLILKFRSSIPLLIRSLHMIFYSIYFLVFPFQWGADVDIDIKISSAFGVGSVAFF